MKLANQNTSDFRSDKGTKNIAYGFLAEEVKAKILRQKAWNLEMVATVCGLKSLQT